MIIRRIQNDELYHHGIKGQNWGIKNGPPYPLGSSVSTGHRLLKKKKVNKNAVDKAYDVPKKLSKFDEGLGRSLNMMKPQGKKDREKTIKTLKVIGVVAGTTLAAAAIYYGGNHIAREYLGKTLKNKQLYRMTLDKIDDVPGRMYVADNLLDSKKYKGMYGKQLLDQANDPMINIFTGGQSKRDRVYQNILKASKAKIAPNAVARKEFDMLYNGDKEFKSIVDKTMNFGKANDWMRGNVWEKALNGERKSRYDAFNIAQSFRGDDIDPKFKDNINKFYDALKKKGYHGIYDMNDIKYSGYNAKSPLIIFDTSNIRVETAKAKAMYELDVKDAFQKAAAIKIGEDAVKENMPYIAGATVYSGGVLYLANRQDKAAKTLRSKAYQDAYKKNTK